MTSFDYIWPSQFEDLMVMLKATQEDQTEFWYLATLEEPSSRPPDLVLCIGPVSILLRL